MSRLENAPSRTQLGRMMLAMIDQFCASYGCAPKSITLDIDDTFDAVHAHYVIVDHRVPIAFWDRLKKGKVAVRR